MTSYPEASDEYVALYAWYYHKGAPVIGRVVKYLMQFGNNTS